MNNKLKRNIFWTIGSLLLAVGLIFTILLICLSCSKISIGKNYTYNFGDLGEEYAIEVTARFKNEDYVTYDAFMGTESDTFTTRYKISSDHRLFLKADNDDWVQYGVVNAYEIKLSNKTTASYGLNMELVMECKSAKTARIIYIVFMTIGYVGGVAGIVVQIAINKKKPSIGSSNNLDVVE